MNFKALVTEYSRHPANVISMRARFGDLPTEQLVLLHKMEKHREAGTRRGVAKYLALFLREFPSAILPSRAKEIARNLGIHRRNVTFIGYKNELA